MQAPLLLQPPPLLALAQQVNFTRPRVPQHFLFDDLSSLIDLPKPMTVESDSDYSSQSGVNYTYAAPRAQFDDVHSALHNNLYGTASSSQTSQPYRSLPNISQTSNYSLVSHARSAE